MDAYVWLLAIAELACSKAACTALKYAFTSPYHASFARTEMRLQKSHRQEKHGYSRDLATKALSLPRRLGLLGRGSLLLGGGRASRLAHTAVERGHLLLHVHLQLVLLSLRRHLRRLLRDRHHALLLGHVELHFLLLLLLLERHERLVTLLLELVL